MVQVVVAADATEAEEIQTILRTAGIESKLEDALPDEPGAAGDLPQKVLVAESSLLAAQEAIEAMTEPDELTGD